MKGKNRDRTEPGKEQEERERAEQRRREADLGSGGTSDADSGSATDYGGGSEWRDGGTKAGRDIWEPGSGSYERCFPPGTSIEMADGSARPIEEIVAGDRVRCRDQGRATPADGRVALVVAGTVDRLVRLNGVISASPPHRIFTQRGYLRFDEVRTGDLLASAPEMTPVAVSTVEVLLGPFAVFNLVVECYACFVAEGLLVEDQVGESLVGEDSAESIAA